MESPVLRLVGAVLLLAAALFWSPANPIGIALLTWIAFALGAYLVTRALFALFFTIALVSGAHLALLGLHGLLFWAYVSALTLSTIACVVILGRRFQQRIKETRAERWEHRRK
ncbi:MAG: hypothetical protein RIC89_17550 [Pseudomonadales bacterium]